MPASAPAPAARAGGVAGAVAALLLNALVWGTSWWPFRRLQAAGLHPLWATACIYLIAVLAIVALRPRAPAQMLRSPVLWVLLLASGFTNAAFNWATVVGDVVRVVLLFYLCPVWTVLLARVLLGEAVGAASLARVALALAGAALLLWPGLGTAVAAGADQRLPDALSLAGGFTFALTNVLLRREGSRPTAAPPAARAFAMFTGGLTVSATVASVLALRGAVPLPSAPAHWWLLALGLAVVFVLGNLSLQYGAARLPANVTSVVMLSEVLFASASAWWLHAGAPTAAALMGGACIVAAATLAAVGAGGAGRVGEGGTCGTGGIGPCPGTGTGT